MSTNYAEIPAPRDLDYYLEEVNEKKKKKDGNQTKLSAYFQVVKKPKREKIKGPPQSDEEDKK